MKTKIYSFMKKAILVLLILVVSSGLAFAEKSEKSSKKKDKDDRTFFDRFWELGVTADVGVANNYFAILDFFHETIVIDMDKMYETIGYKGLTLDVGAEVHVFSNILTKNFELGFDVGVDPTVNFVLSKII